MKYWDKVLINSLNGIGLSLVKLNTLSIEPLASIVDYIIPFGQNMNIKQPTTQFDYSTSNTVTNENLMSFAGEGMLLVVLRIVKMFRNELPQLV